MGQAVDSFQMSFVSLCFKEDVKDREVNVHPGIKDRVCLYTSTHKHTAQTVSDPNTKSLSNNNLSCSLIEPNYN